MTIVLADDNLPSRELMREILEASGHLVLEAVNGRDALHLIRQNEPALVFLDLQMPVLDGFGAIRELRSDVRFHNLPVVALTASAMLGGRDRAIAPGLDSYIAKPISLREVREQVRILSSRRSHPGT